MSLCSLTQRVLAASVAAVVGLTLASAPPAGATPANPLVGNWGVHTGKWDNTYPAYQHAHGHKKRLYGKVALRPHAAWFTAHTHSISTSLERYIERTQHGDPNKLVQFALFRQWPDREARRHVPLTAADQAAYRSWMDTVAQTIGNRRVMIILEPDLALDAPGGHTADPAVRLSLVRYAAQRLSSLPNATVYLEAGAPDWLKASTATQLLIDAGIGYTRGFALGGTHHTSVGADVNYAAAIASGLAARGYPGKTAVLDTADNGHPFTYQRYRKHHSHKSFLTPITCKRKRQRVCVTLGVPPTTNVTAYSRKLHLNATQNARLATYVDAFVWVGRPWRAGNGKSFSRKRLLQAARTTPFR
ncbi:Glycosyl hydrolases family 6 [Nocardioides terrae]|uniref:Glucanase n=1 Tax=Nocardioides terrae TaxID=574651 RepID=A0A1I1FRC8_9ACTN|nr:glycoside hydrolase family 6 protein [Nocardioides terrae]SFC00158.1 Glycosyl hydrolases family 6 [Nocardioides terrae]